MPCRVASKKSNLIQCWNKTVLCPHKGTELEEPAWIFYQQCKYSSMAVWSQFYIFLQVTLEDLRNVDTHKQVKLRRLLSAEIHTKRLLTRLQEMQQKAGERAKFLGLYERHVKATRGQGHQFVRCKGLLLKWYRGSGFAFLVKLKSYHLRHLRMDKARYFPIPKENKRSQHDMNVLKSHWYPQVTWEAEL